MLKCVKCIKLGTAFLWPCCCYPAFWDVTFWTKDCQYTPFPWSLSQSPMILRDGRNGAQCISMTRRVRSARANHNDNPQMAPESTLSDSLWLSEEYSHAGYPAKTWSLNMWYHVSYKFGMTYDYMERWCTTSLIVYLLTAAIQSFFPPRPFFLYYHLRIKSFCHDDRGTIKNNKKFFKEVHIMPQS